MNQHENESYVDLQPYVEEIEEADKSSAIPDDDPPKPAATDTREILNVNALAEIERMKAAVDGDLDGAETQVQGWFGDDLYREADTPELDAEISKLQDKGLNTKGLEQRIKTLMLAWNMDAQTAFEEAAKEVSRPTQPKAQPQKAPSPPSHKADPDGFILWHMDDANREMYKSLKASDDSWTVGEFIDTFIKGTPKDKKLGQRVRDALQGKKPAPVKKAPTDVLTADERAFAKFAGMTPAEYAAMKKINSPEQYRKLMKKSS